VLIVTVVRDSQFRFTDPLHLHSETPNPLAAFDEMLAELKESLDFIDRLLLFALLLLLLLLSILLPPLPPT